MAKYGTYKSVKSDGTLSNTFKIELQPDGKATLYDHSALSDKQIVDDLTYEIIDMEWCDQDGNWSVMPILDFKYAESGQRWFYASYVGDGNFYGNCLPRTDSSKAILRFTHTD